MRRLPIFLPVLGSIKQASWSSASPGCLYADYNYDGVVSSVDFSMFAQHWMHEAAIFP